MRTNETNKSYLVDVIGKPTTCWESYTEALVYVMDVKPGCYIGHPSDIPDGGEIGRAHV